MSIETSQRENLRRMPTRRKRVKRSVWRKTIWPLLKFAVIAAIIVFIGNLAADKVVRPFKLYSREYREVQELAAELERLKKENASLQRRIKYLQTPQGAGMAARKLGWVKPGEISLVLPPEENEAKQNGASQ